MSEIYNRTSQVYIWLGVEADKSARAVSLMKSICSVSTSFTGDKFSYSELIKTGLLQRMTMIGKLWNHFSLESGRQGCGLSRRYVYPTCALHLWISHDRFSKSLPSLPIHKSKRNISYNGRQHRIFRQSLGSTQTTCLWRNFRPSSPPH